MKWEDILKVDIDIAEAKRLGRNYAIEDMYEAKLISEEEYNRLSEEDKGRYHSRIENFLSRAEKKGVTIPEKNLKFHRTMFRRIGDKSKLPTQANFYDGYLEEGRRHLPARGAAMNTPEIRARAYATRKKRYEEKYPGRTYGVPVKFFKPPKEEPPRPKPIPTLIVDYFKMYRDRGLGIPTVEDISREEERPLTVEELEGYTQYRAGLER
jgi:hypothetical protein